jgi:DNA-binding MarR family transcriptional regulator
MVGRHPGVDAGELADLLRIHPSTFTGILARLERGKYLIRVVDQRDAGDPCSSCLPAARA